MSVVIGEVGLTMLAAGLVGGDELVVDVEGADGFVVGEAIYLSPDDIEGSEVILFLGRQDHEHFEAIEEALAFCGLQGPYIFPDTGRVDHLILICVCDKICISCPDNQ